MTPQSKSKRVALFGSVSMMVLGAVCAIYFAFRWAHFGQPDTEAKHATPLILSVMTLVGGVIRFLYRDKRNYFAELMEQRRSSGRSDTKELPIIKGWN